MSWYLLLERYWPSQQGLLDIQLWHSIFSIAGQHAQPPWALRNTRIVEHYHHEMTYAYYLSTVATRHRSHHRAGQPHNMLQMALNDDHVFWPSDVELPQAGKSCPLAAI